MTVETTTRGRDDDAPSNRRTEPMAAATARVATDYRRTWLERLRNDPWYSAISVGLDTVSAAAAVLLAQWWVTGPVHDRGLAATSWLFVPFVVVALATRKLYRKKLNHGFVDDFEPVETSVAVAALATLTAMLVLVPPLPHGSVVTDYVRPSDLLVRLLACAGILIPAVRLARSIANRWLRRKLSIGAPVLVVGAGPVAHQLISRMRQVPDYGLAPAGILDDRRPTDADQLGVPYLGTTGNLASAVRATRAEELVIAPSSASDEQLARVAQQAHGLGLKVRVVPRVMDAVGRGTWVEHLGGTPLMVLNRVNPRGWQFAVKHAVGRLLAVIGLVVISPVFLTLMLLVKFSSPGPIFFGQDRIGRDGRIFQCLKFRSMRPATEADAAFELQAGAAPGGVEGVDRRTWIGKIMRKTSLDELPQLLNVVTGDMTLVGPRPERPEFVELFEIQIRRYGERHRVKAGMTGWAQVHGLRGQTSIAERAEFDNYYIENWNLLLDLKILALTVLAVLRPQED